MHKIMFIFIIFLGWDTLKRVRRNIKEGQHWGDDYDKVYEWFPNWFHLLYGIVMLIMGIFLLIFI
jgi:hypothetical protein